MNNQTHFTPITFRDATARAFIHSITFATLPLAIPFISFHSIRYAAARDSIHFISFHFISLHHIPSIKFTGNSVIIVP